MVFIKSGVEIDVSVSRGIPAESASTNRTFTKLEHPKVHQSIQSLIHDRAVCRVIP